MKAYAIVVKGNPISECGFKFLVASSEDVGNDFEVERFDATTPDTAPDKLKHHQIWWNYPWEGEQMDLSLLLLKRAYQTKNPLARIGCFISHYELWHKAVELDEPILILEHDAQFIKRFDLSKYENGEYANLRSFIIGINSPFSATRKSNVFHEKIQHSNKELQPCPHVDDDITIPQGLAGNSAYVIGPVAAKEMIRITKDVGAWPNDALMCGQLFPYLFVTKEYYTRVQGLRSTTTS